MSTTFFTKLNEYFNVCNVNATEMVGTKNVPMGKTLGDQLLGMATLKWLMNRNHDNPSFRKFFEANAVIDCFVKEEVFAKVFAAFDAAFSYAPSAHSVGDAFEQWIFALHYFGKSVEEVGKILEPYFTWVEGATQIDAATLTAVFQEASTPTFDLLESKSRREEREVHAIHRYELREKTLAMQRAKLEEERLFEVTPPVSRIDLRRSKQHCFASDHVLPKPILLEWTTRKGNPVNAHFFFCCGQLACIDGETEGSPYFSRVRCECDSSLAYRMHQEDPEMPRNSKSRAKQGAPIAEWHCCASKFRPSPQTMSALPTLRTMPCTRKRPREEDFDLIDDECEELFGSGIHRNMLH